MINPDFPDFTNNPASAKRSVCNFSPRNYGKSPIVSIITPFYNTPAEIFDETARSVFQQSFQQWEWLIINDGSNAPDSAQVLDKYRDLDPRIQVIDLAENGGPSRARNTGFNLARSAYLLLLDSDDLLEPTAAEKWLWFLETHPKVAFVKGYSVGFGADNYLWTRGFHEAQAFLQENLVEPIFLIRRAVWQVVGGYDESNRLGLEDWDFWLKCAANGFWGDTIPEYLSWYRRRINHENRWPNWGDKYAKKQFHAQLRQRYPHLWAGAFPHIPPKWPHPYDLVPFSIPFENHLDRKKKRLLMIIPWLSIGGADKFNLDAIGQLVQLGWEVTVVTTTPGDYSWEPEFYRLTPDIFVLHRFLDLVEYPRFLQYLIRSRQFDLVMISNSESGYMLLPYLRACCPEPAYVDFCHMEEDWKNGGYPRKTLVYQSQLDLNLVASNHLKNWMVNNGGEPGKIEVCYLNIDTDYWKPDPTQRVKTRLALGLSGDMPIILYTGRLVAQKRPLMFAQILVRLIQSGEEFFALVVGDGPQRVELEQFIRQHPMLAARIKIFGAQPSEKVREFMQAADIFFLPSEQEGIALTLYEALACGLPVVGAEVGGQSELVSPECGYLIPHLSTLQEIERYVKALRELLQDENRRHLMGNAGRSLVEANFPIEKMGSNLTRLFEKSLRLKNEQPCLAVPVEIGQIVAQESIESLRLYYLAEELWGEKDKFRSSTPQVRGYLYMRNLLLSFTYQHGIKLPGWLLRLNRNFKNWLQL